MTRPRSFLRLLSMTLVSVILCAACLLAGGFDPDHVKQLRATGKCPGCDLRDADLGGVDAQFGDLKNADIRGAMLYKAILRNADLTGALLTFANLKGADLRGARGANLDGAETDERTTCPGGNSGPCK